ncbi:hypothetical protein HMPREF9371_0665 [Neisseria shayeganii 871]|uniref:Uncharacterized protein n=1 Tax=Neisseria shayeganii 871 TaxID=1032488 RepID=G4CGC6_9NEIS|nr:hypothetical protein HMPREF9371_0665 [Neisseria shayeganii 871]
MIFPRSVCSAGLPENRRSADFAATLRGAFPYAAGAFYGGRVGFGARRQFGSADSAAGIEQQGGQRQGKGGEAFHIRFPFNAASAGVRMPG